MEKRNFKNDLASNSEPGQYFIFNSTGSIVAVSTLPLSRHDIRQLNGEGQILARGKLQAIQKWKKLFNSTIPIDYEVLNRATKITSVIEIIHPDGTIIKIQRL